ncbi:hypothetical protein F5888DRAFT_1238855 [Russula emetica]|nr:hypothetical protein F5888DRAFT_1238855 [Russula emetica]
MTCSRPDNIRSRWFFRWSTPTAPTKTIEVQRVQVDELFQILRGGEELEETEPRGPMCHLVTQKELSEVPHESRGAILVSDVSATLAVLRFNPLKCTHVFKDGSRQHNLLLFLLLLRLFSRAASPTKTTNVPPTMTLTLLRSILLNVCGECRRLLHQHHHPPPRQSEGSKWPRT